MISFTALMTCSPLATNQQQIAWVTLNYKLSLLYFLKK
jgi:hypothetical protein